jgi:cellulose synthase/poly-beta-1,6-N-acetylglucosamine synthase-like glycosyltransferase
MNLFLYILLSIIWFVEIIFLIGNINMISFYISIFLDRITYDDSDHINKKVNGNLDEENYYPFITIIIPAFDESNVIGRTIERFMKVDYPLNRYEILVAVYETDNSTRDVVKKYMKTYSNIREAINSALPPTTKAQNVNNAYLYVDRRTEIVGLHDAEDIISDNIFKSISTKIKDNDCIQVKIVVDIDNNSSLSEIASAISFSRYYNFSIFGKKILGHLLFSSGTGTYIKKDVLDKLILKYGFFLDEKNIVEDFELSIRLAIIGHKIEYNSEAEVKEKFPNNFSSTVRQRTRWSTGNLQTYEKYGIANNFSLNERLGFFMDLFSFNAQALWIIALVISLFCLILPLFIDASDSIIKAGSALWYVSVLNTFVSLEKIFMSPSFLKNGDNIKIKYHRVIISTILNDIINTAAFVKASYRFSVNGNKAFKWDKTEHL